MGGSTALITGVAGQDGIHLARLLSHEGTRVVGTVLPGSTDAAAMAVYLRDVHVVPHDVRDGAGFAELLERRRPDEVYNLAGFSSVGASWDHPDLVAEVNGTAVERMVEALVAYRGRTSHDVRFFQASSAEELGPAPLSPYARAKAVARGAVASARERGLFACAGILHNHESPLRPPTFVTRKITRAAAEIRLGRAESLSLGNLDVTRDWGAAVDYVAAMRRMMELEEPRELMIATGVRHRLDDVVRTAFDAAGIADPAPYVVQDPSLRRPADAASLPCDIGPTIEALGGWRPPTSFAAVIGDMVEVDLRRLRTGVEESPSYLMAHR